MDNPFTVDVRPVRSETISALEYLRLMAERPSLIKRAEFISPKPGSRGFGTFFVRYTRDRAKRFGR
jgi:hypothetical protein